MLCPKCGTSIVRMIELADGSIFTPCCDDFSEVGTPIEYQSPATQQKQQQKREQHAKDTGQKWKDKTQPQGWHAVQDFIKAHKNEPERLDGYSDKRLRESGVVSPKVADEARRIRKPQLTNQ